MAGNAGDPSTVAPIIEPTNEQTRLRVLGEVGATTGRVSTFCRRVRLYARDSGVARRRVESRPIGPAFWRFTMPSAV